MKTSWKRTLVWSVIAAAFIGPGTVTTATKAGSEGGFYYIPYVLIAMGVGYLLMEMAARLTLITRSPLGKIVRGSFGSITVYGLFVAVCLGCAAYQAGNLLGGFAGLKLFSPLPKWVLLFPVVIILAILNSGSITNIGRWLTGIVVLMGFAFLYTGIKMGVSQYSILANRTFNIQTGTILGIIGTTIVPYNFFLAAGLGQHQALNTMRRGLGLSFIMGGVITIGVMLTGLALVQFNDFNSLAAVLNS